MKIKATIHFSDGQILEKEFQEIDIGRCSEYRTALESLRIWLQHTPWIEMPDNTFLPTSRIQKVTWEEVPSE